MNHPNASSFYRRYSLKILVLFAFAFPTLIVLTGVAVRSHQNRVQDWLPADFPETRELAEFRKNFASDQFVVVSWEGCHIGGEPYVEGSAPDDPRIEQLACLLTGEPEAPIADLSALEEIKNQENENQANENGTSGESAELTSIAKPPVVDSSEPAPAQTTESDDSKALRAELPNYIGGVTTARRVLNRMTAGENPVDYSLAVRRLVGSLLGPDGKKSCLVIFLSDKSLNCFEELLSRKTQTGRMQVVSPEGLLFKAMCSVGINPDTAAVGGPPVDNVAIDQEGQRTLMRLAGISALLGLGLAWMSLRSMRLTAMVFACGIISAASSLALVALMGDHTDAILFSMPPLVYVLAISGAIHLINYYRQAVEDNGHDGAVETAFKAGWKPAILCCVTTALGLLSLTASELTPIRKFGFYSASGVMLMLATLFLLLPAMLSIWPVGKRLIRSDDSNKPLLQESWANRFWKAMATFIVRRYVAVLALSLVFIAAMSYGLTKAESNIDLMKLFHPQARILKDYHWLEENLGKLVPMEIVLRFDHRFMTDDAERQRDLELKIPSRPTLSLMERIDIVRNVQVEVYRKFGAGGKDWVGPSVAATTFIPPFPQPNGPFRDEFKRRAVKSNLEKNLASVQETGYLRIDPHTGDELWRISLRVAAFEGVDYGEFTNEIKKAVDPVVRQSTAHIKHIDPVVSTTYTGVIPIVYKAQSSLLTSLISSTWWSFLTITPLLMWVSRSFWGGIVAMLPNILPVIFIFGSMGWLGYDIDIGSMMAASIALGVAVDDTIHFLTWYRHELDVTGNRQEAIVGAYRHCATPTLQASMINGLGLCVFAFSTFVPTQKFGVLMLAILFAGMVAELVLLPALLASPLGCVFEPKKLAPDAMILEFPKQRAA